ncbi:MAG: hypothetical protein R3291_04120, partial [Thermoplasmata archaeon]|nr:hypothetical protein [Thermoplasmata archaeon]
RGVDLDIYFATPALPSPPEDTEPPGIEILSPLQDEDLTSPHLVVSGTAEDNVKVDRVEVTNDDGATWFLARGTRRWDAVFTDLPLGETVIVARATDLSGNSAMATVTVRIVERPPAGLSATDPLVLLLLASGILAVSLATWWRVRKPRS